ncbi:biotin/lipoyl-containing protein [Amycolatopsis jejuensis]|uniref:biotin/lipoyl-containing protein n=1 Tax=Amycolatopsis jejuensis TaxID=330084 RepID=UPI000527404D|nr:biotin/lipoyl-containing protein [Amycolatopsis jejuensis]
MTEVAFPFLSDGPAEGVVATWFTTDGATVSEGELLGEVAVDKVDAEVTAPVAGVVRLLAKEGEVVSQGTVIARIE